MRKLTLQEIAPYLPYKLKIEGARGIMYEVIGVISVEDNVILNAVKCDSRNGVNFEPANGLPKLLLRPLSSLTKEITVNGETFVPIVELAKIAFPNSSWSLKDGRAVSTLNTFIYVEGWGFIHYQTNGEHYSGVPNQIKLFQKLHEFHIDLYGLIESGLAIDKSTLKKMDEKNKNLDVKHWPDAPNVEKTEYDFENHFLYVTYTNNKRFRYIDVSAKIWEDMKSAQSIGSFLNRNIKGFFRYEQV